MFSNKTIKIVGLASVVVVTVFAGIFFKKNPESRTEKTQLQDEVLLVYPKNSQNAEISTDKQITTNEELKKPSNAVAKVVETESKQAPVHEEKKNCVDARFESKAQELNFAATHEMKIDDELAAKSAACVLVDGKAVLFQKKKEATVLILQTKIRNPKAKVEATFCETEQECQKICPKAEEDFWDNMATVDEQDAGGFVGADVAEGEKKLKTELAALRSAINKRTGVSVVSWTLSSKQNKVCQ